MIKFYLNGKLAQVEDKHAFLMLSDYLRLEKCLTGTKVVCAEGDCGACSTLKYNPLSQGEDSNNFLSINSCIAPLISLHGSHILTIESLENKGELHEAQTCMRECHGSQCGFCTPGFVMALAALCDEKISKKDYEISEQEGKNALTGNLCRCTGYDTIIKAATSVDLKKETSLKERYHSDVIEKELEIISNEELIIKNDECHFFAPKTYKAAQEYLATHENVTIIANATDLGVVYNKRRLKFTNILSLHLIEDAYDIKLDGDEVYVGARVTLTEFRHFLKDKCEEYANYLDIFASPQIKNRATLIGNIANASPIGDNAPVLLSLDADVIIESSKGERQQKLSTFFLDYRKIDLKSDELIKAVRFKLPQTSEFKVFKTSIRKDLDISTLNIAVKTELEKNKVKETFIGAGGIAAIPLRLKKTEDFLRGKELNDKTINEACTIAHTEFTPISDVRSSSSYRRVVFENSLKRILGAFV